MLIILLCLRLLVCRVSYLNWVVETKWRHRLFPMPPLLCAWSALRPLLVAARYLARVLGVGSLDSQVLDEGANLGLTQGLALLVLEHGYLLELIADAHVEVGLRTRCWSFVQPAFVEATLRRSPCSEIGSGNADFDLDRMRPSG